VQCGVVCCAVTAFHSSYSDLCDKAYIRIFNFYSVCRRESSEHTEIAI
jgi:hypothetical protein